MMCFFSACMGLKADSSPNVWEVMRRQFTLNHELGKPEVQQQLHWLVAHPAYLQQFSKSKPYIYHIVTEIKKRNLPGEIALIPMIESAYDPFAYSGAGAAGLWQFMPGTGTDLGLKQDWWFDARRSVGHSTTAALNYLAYLNHFFNNNWILAFAAYDSGEGTVLRAIKNAHQAPNHGDFWSLSLPNETKAYVPRLLALAEIVQNPHRYHVTLPDIPHEPYFKEVNIHHSIDLDRAAKLAGISYHEMIKLNPGFNRWKTTPFRPYKLLIPVNKVDNFNRNLANLNSDKQPTWPRRQVSAGESLQITTQNHHKTVDLIQTLNHPTVSENQQKVLHFAAPKQLKMIHIVSQNDTYASILKRYHISAKQLQHWNHLKQQAKLRTGQSLIIWRQVSA